MLRDSLYLLFALVWWSQWYRRKKKTLAGSKPISAIESNFCFVFHLQCIQVQLHFTHDRQKQCSVDYIKQSSRLGVNCGQTAHFHTNKVSAQVMIISLTVVQGLQQSLDQCTIDYNDCAYIRNTSTNLLVLTPIFMICTCKVRS